MSAYDKIVGATAEGLLPPAVLANIGPAITETGTQPVGKNEIQHNVLDYGAVAGSAASNTPAFMAAITAAAADRHPVTVPAGVYTLANRLDLPSGTDLRLEPGAVLDFATANEIYYIGAIGSIGSTVAVTATGVEGAYDVTAPGHGLVAGDWVRLGSLDVYDSANTSTPLGELIQVSGVAADVVTFWTPLRDTYATSPTIQKVTMVSDVRITGGTIRGNYTADTIKSGIVARFAENVHITGVRTEGIDLRHYGIDCCVNAWITDCTIYWAQTGTAAYGTSFANCTRDSGAVRNRFVYVRHSLSTNNDGTGNKAGVVRRITFAFNTVESSSRALGGSMGGGDAIDTHGAAEDIDILYNTVNGSTGQGINIECRSGKVIGNTIMNTQSNGIGAHNETDRDSEFVVSNNTIRNANGWGIRVNSGGRGGVGRNRGIVVTGNVIKKANNGIQVGRSVGALTDSSATVTGNSLYQVAGISIEARWLDTFAINGNTIYDPGTHGIYAYNASYGSIGPDSIRTVVATNFVGILAESTTWTRIQPGAIRSDGTGNIGISIPAGSTNISVGATSHIRANTVVSNLGGSTVVVGT